MFLWNGLTGQSQLKYTDDAEVGLLHCNVPVKSIIKKIPEPIRFIAG